MVRRYAPSPARAEEHKRTRSVFVTLTLEQHEQLSRMAAEQHLTLPFLFELSVWGRNVFEGKWLEPIQIRFMRRALVNTRTNLEQLQPYVSGEDAQAVQTAHAQVQRRIDDLTEILECFSERLRFRGWPPKKNTKHKTASDFGPI